jgi:RimJ/RimL family protein N-acetyltransferase
LIHFEKRKGRYGDIMTSFHAHSVDPMKIDLPMPILTPRLLIRPPEPGDGEVLARAVNETWDDLYPWFHRYLGPKDKETDPRWKEAFVCRSLGEFHFRTRMTLFGFERESGDFAISTGFPNLEWRIRRFEIDYWVPKSKQKNGYAAEGVNGLLQYAFRVMEARVITLSHAEGNKASRAVAERLHFTHAVRRPYDYEMPDGSLVDSHGYYRLGTECLPALEVIWGAKFKNCATT